MHTPTLCNDAPANRHHVLAIIQAGGAGSRMDVLTRERAKPALPFAGVWLSVSFQGSTLEEQVSNGRTWDPGPGSVGCPPDTAGYPICTATVERPFRGYDSLMGWVQLVRSEDNDSGGEHFEMDPLAFLGDLPHPYCWLGLNPTLFDAPSRSPRVDMDWMAHSFLCVPDDVGNGLEARPMLGFSWGFVARDGEITLVPPEVLDGSAWDEHLDTLRERHPGWHFSSGLANLA